MGIRMGKVWKGELPIMFKDKEKKSDRGDNRQLMRFMERILSRLAAQDQKIAQLTAGRQSPTFSTVNNNNFGTINLNRNQALNLGDVNARQNLGLLGTTSSGASLTRNGGQLSSHAG